MLVLTCVQTDSETVSECVETKTDSDINIGSFIAFIENPATSCDFRQHFINA